MKAVELSQALVRIPSVTPHKDDAPEILKQKNKYLHDCFEVLERELKPMGFVCERITFDEPGFPSIPNLFAKRGKDGKHLNFVGHVDVVPPGDEKAWTLPPFSGEIKNGLLYGRGTSDMKANIACFIDALRGAAANGTVSLLIIGDEEAYAVNGAPKMVQWLEARGEKFDWCLVGEPSNPTALGQEIKNGRRGTANFFADVFGKQGHIAYPDRFDNPMNRIGAFISAWSGKNLDEGNEYFAPSHLEANIIDCANRTTNIVPGKARVGFNIRWNNLWTRESLEKKVREMCNQYLGKHELHCDFSGGVFLTPKSDFLTAIQESVREVTGKFPEATTHGGTSDGRFMAPICANVVECGLVSATIHQIDENAAVKDIEDLTKVYSKILAKVLR
jgi:succinyl-diaminopimelate desuccinylase